MKNINEGAQIGDTVTFNGEKGYIVGQTNSGDLIVQVQGSTHLTDPDKVKPIGEKKEILKPPFEFDKITQQNLTIKALFEQYVKCGIYLNNTPIKINDCYTKYSDWSNASMDQMVNVLVEGHSNLLPKSQVKILEDANSFANPDNYVPGAIIDEATENVLENVMINVEDFTGAIGDANMVRIIRQDSTLDSVPSAILRTLSV